MKLEDLPRSNPALEQLQNLYRYYSYYDDNHLPLLPLRKEDGQTDHVYQNPELYVLGDQVVVQYTNTHNQFEPIGTYIADMVRTLKHTLAVQSEQQRRPGLFENATKCMGSITAETIVEIQKSIRAAVEAPMREYETRKWQEREEIRREAAQKMAQEGSAVGPKP